MRAKGVLASQFGTDSSSIKVRDVTVVDGKATAGNGGHLFTVERNGGYYRFMNEYDEYLGSNGTGNNAFYQKTGDESADWKLSEFNKGFKMESRVAKFNGQHAQFLECYGDSYKNYSFYKVDLKNYDIFTFRFLPCANEAKDMIGGIINQLAVVLGELRTAYVSKDYILAFTVDAPFSYKSSEVTLHGEKYTPELVEGQYVVTISAAEVKGEKLKEQSLYAMTAENGATEQILNNWNSYKGSVADFNARQSDVIALAGFEMTWSGGPGHINTFNMPGIVSRNKYIE